MAGNIKPVPPHYFPLEEYFALESARDDYSATTETIECPSIGIVLTLAEIYQGVTFE